MKYAATGRLVGSRRSPPSKEMNGADETMPKTRALPWTVVSSRAPEPSKLDAALAPLHDNHQAQARRESLPIHLVVADPGVQPRVKIDADRVAKYQVLLENGEIANPIVVFFDRGQYVLADGFHRHAAARELGWKQIPAEVRIGTRRDALLYAVSCDLCKGRTLADRRRACSMILADEQWAKWNDSEIGRRCGLDHKTVKKLRGEPHPGNSQGTAQLVSRSKTVYLQNKPARKGDTASGRLDPNCVPGDVVSLTSGNAAHDATDVAPVREPYRVDKKPPERVECNSEPSGDEEHELPSPRAAAAVIAEGETSAARTGAFSDADDSDPSSCSDATGGAGVALKELVRVVDRAVELLTMPARELRPLTPKVVNNLRIQIAHARVRLRKHVQGRGLRPTAGGAQ